MKPANLIIVGAGGRGSGYAGYALKFPEQARVVGVADPDPIRRERMAAKHDLPPQNVFTDWQAAAEAEKLADAVLICTQDSMHADPAVAFAEKGYHILLEKPMAPSLEDCERIAVAVRKAGIIFTVCHVLRYTSYTRRLKAIIDSGRIGELVSLQRLEPVGYWHQAHSYVRGNWRNESESSSMLLAKSCHDLDWISYIMGRPCRKVQSFGSLKHFKPKNKPDGAADRCLECGVESKCPYSAKKIYLKAVENGRTGWPIGVLHPDPSPETIKQALTDGPYGRCVYSCDNDVVDHQVVNMEFEGGASAAFTMTAFTPAEGRHTRIFGTKGMITGNDAELEVFDFLTDEREVIDTNAGDASILGGHGGGDGGLMGAFVKALNDNDPSSIVSGIDETLESHAMVFKAEISRHNNTVELIEGKEEHE